MNKVEVKLEVIDAIPEIQLIHLLMQTIGICEDKLTTEEESRAVEYFYNWYKAINNE